MPKLHDAARELHGVNSTLIKRTLKTLGYFYRHETTGYRVYSKFRDKLFAERVAYGQDGKRDIYVQATSETETTRQAAT